jgi:hypothetical protein
VEFTPAENPTYTLKVRDQGTLAQDAAIIEVTVLPAPTPTVVQSPDPMCLQTPGATLDAGAGFSSYTWRDDASQVVGTSQTLVVDETACGRTYTVEVVGGNGCSATVGHQVTCTR